MWCVNACIHYVIMCKSGWIYLSLQTFIISSWREKLESWDLQSITSGPTAPSSLQRMQIHACFHHHAYPTLTVSELLVLRLNIYSSSSFWFYIFSHVDVKVVVRFFSIHCTLQFIKVDIFCKWCLAVSAFTV
jgi:hypothetical protein